MGLSHVAAELQAAKLSPRLSRQQPLERGHGRGKIQPADKTDVGLRGVPVIGHGSGAIANSAPGGELGQAARLERDASEMRRNGKRLVRDRLRYRAT